jgi:hypothetical protein
MLMQRPQIAAEGAVQPAAGGLAEGAEVLTPAGAVAVETLAPGDRIVTRAGTRVLRGVSMRELRRARLVRISARALGPDRPERDVAVAADQPMLVRDWRARALRGVDRALMPAARLADGEYIRAEARSGARLYTLHFDAPEVIYVHGLELGCEAPLPA